MKYKFILAASLLTLTTFAQAESLCQQKEQAIQREIDFARKHDNTHKVSGLERALTEVREHCTDERLKQEHQEKIQKHQQKVTERERELQQERDKGDDSKKIAKREKKLADAQRELKEVQAAPY